PNRDIGQSLDRAQIGSRAARTGNGEAASREPVAGQFFETSLGWNSQGNAAHARTSASRRSTHTAHPEAGIGAVAPSRSSNRSYWPPDASISERGPVISNTMPV